MEKALAMWLLLAAQPAAPATPTQVVQTAVEQVVLADAATRHRGQIRRIAEQLIDFPGMARRALADHWQDRTAQERDEFVPLFKSFFERAYAGRLEKYSGERIVYVSETVVRDSSTVRSKLITTGGAEIPLDYRLRLSGSRWAVVDIAISGVSLVSNYRGEFNRVIQTSSYETLLRELRLKRGAGAATFRPGGRPVETGLSLAR
jgi:phospholipid transport system substrate-binding protein